LLNTYVGKTIIVPATPSWPATYSIRPNLEIPGQFPFSQSIRLIVLSLLCLVDDEDSLRNGIVNILLFKELSWANFNLANQKLMMDTTQNKLPIRFKHVYMVEPPWILRAIRKLTAPFMKQKLLDRQRHATLESLRAEVPLDRLPEYLGGHFQRDQAAMNQALNAKIKQFHHVHEAWKLLKTK
jgi:hypothetical protein